MLTLWPRFSQPTTTIRTLQTERPMTTSSSPRSQRTASCRSHLCLTPAALGLLWCEAAWSQPVAISASATYSLVASEVDRNSHLPSSASPGVIDPNEAVRLTVGVQFTPPVGSTVAYVPASPPPGSGVVIGWATTLINLLGTGGTVGAFSARIATAGFDPTQGFGNPDGIVGFGAVSHYFATGQGQQSVANPITDLVTFVWTPAEYAPRTVSFATGNLPAVTGVDHGLGLLLAPGQPFPVRVPAGSITHLGTGPIVIVPAPAAFPLLLAGLVPRRRRSEADRRRLA